MYKLILISLPFFLSLLSNKLKKKLKVQFNLKLTQRRIAIKNKLQYEDWKCSKKFIFWKSILPYQQKFQFFKTHIPSLLQLMKL